MSVSNICHHHIDRGRSPCQVAHFLIGVPGSGKSTFAAALAKLGNYVIISTDEIRSRLYGDAAIQGNWHEIENQALILIRQAQKSGKGVIYDATNFKRAFRMDFLIKLKDGETSPHWIAWHFKTPIETCIEWNQKRDRQVPQPIIESMSRSLANFPPLVAEGFAAVEDIDITKFPPDTAALTAKIEKRISTLQRSIINRNNRTQNNSITFHRYSGLLDFDRLMHLISLIIKYPGIGDLHSSNPNLLAEILGHLPEITSHVDEITKIMAELHGTIYANQTEINTDLQWLEENGVIGGKGEQISPISPPFLPSTNYPLSPFPTHSYSDTEAFQRLIGTISFILHHPFLPNTGDGNLSTLAIALTNRSLIALQQKGIVGGNSLDMLRKDIEKVLKPYQILPEFPMRKGYFAGTGILSQSQLVKVFEIMRSQAQSLDDPLALEIYETFKQRMLQARLIEADTEVYPVRAIANRSIVDPRYLHSTNLMNNLPKLETAISQGELLELNRFSGSGGYDFDPKSFFLAYPLQIVFSNLAWYLGFECVSGNEAGLLRFERLDRLFLGNQQNQMRLRSQQEKSLQQLQALLKGSAGLFLGNSVAEQRKFLSQDKQVRLTVCMTVELWFNDDIYKFITEGTKRFAQIKMSPPISQKKTNLPKSVFCLAATGDQQFPNRFQAILPKWSLSDFDLWRWIVGFGGNVKVIQPIELVDKIKGIGSEIVDVYKEIPN